MELEFCFASDDLARTPLTGGRERPLESRDDCVFVTFSFVVVDEEVRFVGGAGGVGDGGDGDGEAGADMGLVGGEGDAGSALVENDLARGEGRSCT